MTESLSVRNHRALLREHRIGVVWFLDQQLMDTSELLRTMMEQRALVEMKKRDLWVLNAFDLVFKMSCLTVCAPLGLAFPD